VTGCLKRFAELYQQLAMIHSNYPGELQNWQWEQNKVLACCCEQQLFCCCDEVEFLRLLRL
jgi:hypothetical protein